MQAGRARRRLGRHKAGRRPSTPGGDGEPRALDDVEPGVRLDDGLTEGKLTSWQIVCSGYRLSLPLLSEYRDRVSGIATELANRQVAQEQRARAQLIWIAVA